MECVICLEDLDDIKYTIKLICGHCFCRGCILDWANNNKNTCPLCRSINDNIYVYIDINDETQINDLMNDKTVPSYYKKEIMKQIKKKKRKNIFMRIKNIFIKQ